ncbi:MAG: ABC transporter ATP-binding protein [Vicinamibacterales bacterium]|jgi:molybdate transport system ATP-binding protein|nr:ABC transporter ATP-binding protein [Vicinamibacterales bacterium]
MSLLVEIRHDAPSLDLRLDLPEGAITSVVGPSGSGKTSTMRVVAGLWAPASGLISLGGATWFKSASGINLPPRDRSIGVVPQRYALFPHLTARENVEAALLHLPRARRTPRAEAALARAHVAGLEARYPHELSGGQQQRVAVARAIAREPRVLLLDEPFSSVDRSTRKHLYAELKRLHAELDCTVMLVTHDLDEAALLSSRLCLIRRGRLVQAGATQDVLARPESAEAARLLDYGNIFRASVVAHDRDRRLSQLDWHGVRIAAPIDDRFAPGQPVDWAISHAEVLPADAGAHFATENTVPATVRDMVTLGDDLHLRLSPDPAPALTLHMKVSRHVAFHRHLAAASPLLVRLTPSAIITMAPSDDADGAGRAHE